MTQVASKIYQTMVNKYISTIDPENKRSRLLYPGEYHIPLHNFSGPGTRMDLKEVREFPAYNNIDECSKIHDIGYDQIKDIPLTAISKGDKADLIKEADKEAIECYDKYPKEYGYNLARAGINTKITAEKMLTLLKGTPSVFYGGLINNYTENDLIRSRNPEYYTDNEKKIIKLFRLNDKDTTTVLPIGSFTYAIQKYPSDIDINEVIQVSNAEDFVNDLKVIIKNISKMKNSGIYFSDFKAGTYIDTDNGEEKGMKWSVKEILDGYNNKYDIKLEDAIINNGKPSVIKLDIIVIDKYNSRIIEASSFFILKLDGDRGYLNIPHNFFELYINGLKKDIIKYSTSKVFKSIKRLWSLSRVTRDIETLRKLEDVISSNLSLLSQISADLETMYLFIDKYGLTNTNKKYMINILDLFLKKLSTIADIEIPTEIFERIENLKSIIVAERHGDLLAKINVLIDIIQKIINDESKKYLFSKKINLQNYGK